MVLNDELSEIDWYFDGEFSTRICKFIFEDVQGFHSWVLWWEYRWQFRKCVGLGYIDTFSDLGWKAEIRWLSWLLMTFRIIREWSWDRFEWSWRKFLSLCNASKFRHHHSESCDIKLPRQLWLNSNLEISSCLPRRRYCFGYTRFVGLAGSDQFPFGATCCTEIWMPNIVITSCAYVRLFLSVAWKQGSKEAISSTEIGKRERTREWRNEEMK